MSEIRSRRARQAGFERDRCAAQCLDGDRPSSELDESQRYGEVRAGADCGEIADSGPGLGAFYAYQMAVRSIERG